MKCRIGEVLKLVQHPLEKNISREIFDEIVQFRLDNDSVKVNSISNRVCLSILKDILVEMLSTLHKK